MAQKQSPHRKNRKTITVPAHVGRDLRNMSAKLHRPEKDILADALQYYRKMLEQERQLQDELQAWEKASDEDLLVFEGRL